MVFGWYRGLEGNDKEKGMKRKTVLYWKRILRDSGVNWADVERLCADKNGWKQCVGERMKYLDKWKRKYRRTYVRVGGRGTLG